MTRDDVTPELQAKARSCKTTEELLALAKAEGYELSDQELDAVAGGFDWGEIGDNIADCTSMFT